MAELTYRDAVARGIAQEMARDERVVFLGEDVGAGRRRVQGDRRAARAVRPEARARHADLRAGDPRRRDGRGDDGLAADRRDHVLRLPRGVLGQRRQRDRQDPLHDQRPDHVPLVIRTGNGAGSRFGAQHSQSVENWAMAIPGLKVVAPSTPRDVDGLLAAAMRDPDPVLFFEHKSLYATKGEVPDGEIVDQLGTAKHRAAGQGLHHRRARADGAARARRRRDAAGGAGHRLRGDRRALAGAARHADHPRLGRAARTACSRSRRIRGCAAGVRRSSRSWPTRRSTTSTGRPCASRRRTSRCPPPTFWRTPCCPMPSGSPRGCGNRFNPDIRGGRDLAAKAQ